MESIRYMQSLEDSGHCCSAGPATEQAPAEDGQQQATG